MNYYTADLHFGHKGVIDFDHRPFENVEVMDEALISLWNQRVNHDDHVYILGDFCYRNEKSAEWYGSYKGHLHFYGHIHNKRDETWAHMNQRENAYNVGCMLHGYRPVRLNEIVKANRS